MINLHIIGAQKSGTSALAYFIGQHPDIFVVKGKEAHVFDHPLFLASPHKMQWARSAFAKKLDGYNGQSICCDATPITLYNPDFLQHCYNYNPQAKFIVILRDPVARAISHYDMSQSRHQEDMPPLGAFMAEQTRLNKSNDWRFESPKRTQSYLTRGCYQHQLNSLFSIVPASQVLVLFNQDLRHLHTQTLEKVWRFLSVDACPIPQQTVFASKTQHFSVIQKLNRLLARCYASAYFFARGETRKNWLDTIERFQGKETE